MAMEMKALVTSHPSFAKYHLDIHCGVATGPCCSWCYRHQAVIV